MPVLRASVRSGGTGVGGALGCLPDQLHQEVAYLAYYLHWPRSEIMSLEHIERRTWVEQVARINRSINAQADGSGGT
ncbi:DUF6760 family protein [Ideonella sp. YS5]|uniref:DUF6760 family protein n=1 Tax=Ideonella sp. YS5 TaxID=3453714 RepID=UPI003EE828C1